MGCPEVNPVVVVSDMQGAGPQTRVLEKAVEEIEATAASVEFFGFVLGFYAMILDL